MVIVAAIIGGFEDIGWEVLSSMRKAEFGQSMLSGLVIALLAILIDRLTIGFARERPTGPTRGHALDDAHAGWRWCCCSRSPWRSSSDACWPDATLLPGDAGCARRSASSTSGCSALSATMPGSSTASATGCFIACCCRSDRHLGCRHARHLGFCALADRRTRSMPLAVLLAAALLLHRAQLAAGVAVLVAGTLLYTGFLGFPWPVFILGVALLACQVAGLRLALFAVGRLLADPCQRAVGARWSSRSISARWRCCFAW